VRFVETFKRLVSLDEMKEAKGLEDMVVIKRGRLSVQPVKQREFDIVRRMGGMK
jgi:predicted RNA-binding protein with PUA-like domain